MSSARCHSEGYRSSSFLVSTFASSSPTLARERGYDMHIGLEIWYVVVLIQIVGAVGRFVTRTIYNGFVRKGNFATKQAYRRTDLYDS